MSSENEIKENARDQVIAFFGGISIGIFFMLMLALIYGVLTHSGLYWYDESTKIVKYKSAFYKLTPMKLTLTEPKEKEREQDAK